MPAIAASNTFAGFVARSSAFLSAVRTPVFSLSRKSFPQELTKSEVAIANNIRYFFIIVIF